MNKEATMLNNRFIDYRFVYIHEVNKSHWTKGSYPPGICYIFAEVEGDRIHIACEHGKPGPEQVHGKPGLDGFSNGAVL